MTRKLLFRLLPWAACLPLTVGRGAAPPWRDAEAIDPPGKPARLAPARGSPREADLAALARLLDRTAAGAEAAIPVPMPDGATWSFRLREDPVLAPELAAAFPEIRTYRGVCADDPSIAGVFDLTPQGFHGMIRLPDDTVYIDPVFADGSSRHRAYRRREYLADRGGRPGPGCRGVVDPEAPASPVERRQAAVATAAQIEVTPVPAAATTLRTYRMAVMADRHFTAYHGGVSGAMAAIATGVSRLNAIYEPELGVRFQLVANNQVLVFTAANDPTANATSLTPLIDARIGSSAYDIGHLVMGSDFGGLATLSSACVAGKKGEGQSGSSVPNNDPFWVDFVAHELGHQLGANHTFNSTTGACGGGNRVAATAYEPGSGSTLMAYANLCSPNNLQAASDAYFHAASLTEIRGYLAGGGGCGSVTAHANRTPVVDGGPDRVIPARTPFTLTATGSDPDGDPLTYVWEQMDLGPASSLASADDGAGPLFRSRPPSSTPSRLFPELAAVLAGNSSTVEKLPVFSRAMKFRVTARDGRNGGTAADDVVLTVASSAGPFTVTYPNTAVTLAGTATVTWLTANTQLSPVNCATVNVLLSTDGGQSFPHVLAAATPNDGSQAVTLPNLNSTQARIRVEAVGNVFFDVSNANFTLTPAAGTPLFAKGGVVQVRDTLGNGNGNGNLDPGESAIEFFIPVRNDGNGNATGVTATLSALTAGVTVSQATQSLGAMAVGVTRTNAVPFLVSLPAGLACGAGVGLRLQLVSTQGGGTLDYLFATGSPVVTQTFSYTGPALAIPDASATGVSASIPVSGVPGTISDVELSFDGSDCANAAGVGLQHPFVGDLTVILRSPAGTEVTLLDRIGSPSPATGPHFCGTRLDDQSAGIRLQDVGPLAGPHSGSYRPMQSLSAFNGQPANGAWTLQVADTVAGNAGLLRAFSLHLRGSSVCAAPDGSPPQSDLSLTAQAAPAVLDQDPLSMISFTARNNGPEPAQEVTVTLPAPAGTVLTQATPAPVMQGGAWIFSLGILQPGASAAGAATFDFSTAPAGMQTRTLTVSSLSQDPSPADNSAAVSVTLADLDNDGIPDLRDPDRDGDGLPDAWELAYFGGVTNALAGADADADGLDNLGEHIAGTDPTDPNDRFEIRAADPAAGFAVDVPGASGRLYTLRRAASLISANWEPVVTDAAATPPVQRLADPAPPGAGRVYRVEVRLP